MEEGLKSQIRHLYEVEGLTRRQIGKKLGICRNRVGLIIRGEQMISPPVTTVMMPYERIIHEWYKEYPFLKASQIYEKMREHDYRGSLALFAYIPEDTVRRKARHIMSLSFFLERKHRLTGWRNVIPLALPMGLFFFLPIHGICM